MTDTANADGGSWLIQGPGAIGRLLAGHLDRAGIPVTLLGRGAPGTAPLAMRRVNL